MGFRVFQKIIGNEESDTYMNSERVLGVAPSRGWGNFTIISYLNILLNNTVHCLTLFVTFVLVFCFYLKLL